MKFSKVEFVAVLACMFWSSRVEIVRLAMEDDEAMRTRVTRVLNDCDLQLLLRMKDAERVKMRCVSVQE
jgi:hypothetical protein